MSEERVSAVGGKRLLLLFSPTGYEGSGFLQAARRLGAEVVAGCDWCHLLKEPWKDGAISLRFEEPEEAARRIVERAREEPIGGIVAVGDKPTLAASLASEALGIPHNPPEAAAACRNKLRSRELFRAGGLRVPWFKSFPREAEPRAVAREVEYPCVLKPLSLSASRGVIRADDPDGFVPAYRRVACILRSLGDREPATDRILAEGFIPGREFALEGLLNRGKLHLLALFDKPDPLDGPYFEETIYVTPSRLAPHLREQLAACARGAAAALGLTEGPIHAELRLNEEGPWILEVAARSIGGLCPRVLEFGAGVSLEEVVIRHALGMELPSLSRSGAAAGVMMIPIPRKGILQRVEGIEEAQKVPGIAEVAITAKLRHPIDPLPEGAAYLGFIFARGGSPQEVEEALREAHRRLRVVITPGLALVGTEPGELLKN